MNRSQASRFYHGPEGYNCAQAVLKYFQNDLRISDEAIASSKGLGGGRAPQGRCGALHAALTLIDDEGMKAELEERFRTAAGASVCRDIRSLNKLSCKDCVDTAAALAEKIMKDKMG